jgi:hypothetical protein
MLVAMLKHLLFCALVIFFLTSPIASPQVRTAAESRWTVNVSDDGPKPTDKKINCHSLKYFQDEKNLKDFDYGAFQLRDLLPDHEDKVHSVRVGEISGFTIHEVIHRVDGDESFRILKMILVERKPEEFCEIYHEQGDSGILIVDPTFIADVGGEKVLSTHDRVPGTGNFYNEAYWTFDNDGPIALDLDVIEEAVGTVVPDGMGVWKGGGFDVASLSYEAGVWKEGDANCCPSGGRVRVKLALKNHKLVVVSKHFEPDK